MSSSDSDSESDVDYVPEDAVVSEDSDSGDAEDAVKTVIKKQPVLGKRNRSGGIRLEGEDQEAAEEEESSELVDESKELVQKKEKKKADDIWATFMSDVGPSKAKTTQAKAKTLEPTSKVAVPPKEVKASTVKVTQVFDFAGEEIRVTKEVSANSKEAKEAQQQVPIASTASLVARPEAASSGAGRGLLSGAPGLKRRGGGLGSVLDKIGKKPKISVLDKSKLDWDQYKDQVGISDDLATHNRGKEGYIERQQFLQRADLRQFELEKSMRKTSSRR